MSGFASSVKRKFWFVDGLRRLRKQEAEREKKVTGSLSIMRRQQAPHPISDNTCSGSSNPPPDPTSTLEERCSASSRPDHCTLIANVAAMASSQLRAVQALTRGVRASSRTFTTSARRLEAQAPAPVTRTSETATVLETDSKAIAQAPNRATTWSRSQKPRALAMTGPRFEQTDFSLQV